MKKLILIAGLAGILVTGAFAQSGNGSSTVPVSVTVNTYMNLSTITGGPLTVTVTDGGFSALYPSSTGSFTAAANIACFINAAVTGNVATTYTTTTQIDSSGYSATQKVSQAISPSTSHTVGFEIAGNATNGLPPATSVSGTMTVTITST